MEAIATVNNVTIRNGMFHFEQRPQETFSAYRTIATELVAIWKRSTEPELPSPV